MSEPTPNVRAGMWLIGACGRVGSTIAIGLAALAKKRAATTSLVSAHPAFRSVPLVDPTSILLGGHELRAETLIEAVEDAHGQAGLFGRDLINKCRRSLRSMQRNICRGTTCGLSADVRDVIGTGGAAPKESPTAAIERLTDDIARFKQRNRLDHVVVINTASSEPAAPAAQYRLSYKALRQSLGRRPVHRADAKTLPSSCLYALAALEAGCPYINFTPSTGISLPAIRERADALGIPYMGSDGKTGETLVKSALAPMFAMRNLSVLSWIGQNILGNRDGAVLKNPRTRASKLRTKDGVVARIVGGSPHTQVSIDYVPSLDDWKVAWDFIHFEGFLGTKMSMQFTWQGCDSILAAPLIIDLVRFTVLECQRGMPGPMRHLAFFFKDPLDVNVHDLAGQWRMLVEHATQNPVGSKSLARIR